MTFYGKVAAVVTTFNPSEAIFTNLARIACQVNKVIVVDDSGDFSKVVDINYAEIVNVILLRNEDNLGIATSLNRGIAQAEVMGYEWVITLDDDTLVSSNYVGDLSVFLQNAEQLSVGLIACRRGGGYPCNMISGNGFMIKRTLITSGCLFKIAAFREVGGFDESMFIDLVDFDFCTKLRKSGKSIVQLNKVGMDHRVGNSRNIYFLGNEIVIYNHSPFRLYYQMRNVFSFTRKHATFDPLLCLYLLIDVFRLPLKALFFEHDKYARFYFLAKGLLDGLMCRGGRLTGRNRSSSVG